MPSESSHLELQHVLNHFSTKTAVDLVLYDTYPEDSPLNDDSSVEGAWELTFETPDGLSIEIDSNSGINKPSQTNVSVFGPEIELDGRINSYASLSELANNRNLGLSLQNSGVIWARQDIPDVEDVDEDRDSLVGILTEAADTVCASLTARLCVENREDLHEIDEALASIRSGMEAIESD